MRPNASSHSLALMFPFRQSGFTLIELMIAMTLGLLLLASLVYVYTNSAQSFRAQSALTLIQNNARYAFEIMGVDIRMAGFTGSQGTKSKLPDSIVSTTSDWCPLVDLFGDKGCTGSAAGPLLGYENSSPAYASARAGTDSLTVVRVDTTSKYAVSAYTAPTFTLTQWYWDASENPPTSEIFVAGDYTHTAIFQVASKNAGAKTVSHDAGLPLGTFGGGANALSLYNLSGVTYYIGTNPAGEPALYRDKLSHSGTTVNSTAEELIEGVEDMQITYGVDTDTDGNVDDYKKADLVATWGNVLSVRITLTLVSQQGIKVTTTGAPLRKEFKNTIAIRNRLL